MMQCLFCSYGANFPNQGDTERIQLVAHIRNDHPQGTLIVVAKSEAQVWFEFAMNFAQLRMNGPETRVFQSPQPQIDSARNEAIEFALQNEVPYVFMLDSDVLLPKDALYRLLRHKKDVVSALYARRHQPTWNEMLVEVVDAAGHESLMSVNEGEYPKEALLAVDCVGAGCVLIRTEVFREIEKPYFQWSVGLAPAGRSEEFTLFRKMRRHGINIYCDTSIRASHINYFKVKPVRELSSLNLDFPAVGLFD